MRARSRHAGHALASARTQTELVLKPLVNAMSELGAEQHGRNAFHALAALGSAKQAGKMLASTPRKTVLANLMVRDASGRTPLHVAAYCGHIRVLNAFLDMCPEAGDVRDSEGNTARDALRRPAAAVHGDLQTHKNFQRFVRVDKNGFEHQDFGSGVPMDVWDVAMSSKMSLIVVESPSGDRSVYSLIHGNELRQLDIAARYVATSNVHSLAVTADRCFAWGKSKNGVLGLDTDEKVVVEPRMLDFDFGSGHTSSHGANAFSALNGIGATSIKDPLIGVSCCDFYSCCYTATKIWCWGTNRGQMLNKAALGDVVTEPVCVFECDRIRSVVACDSALIVLTTQGQLFALKNSRVSKFALGKHAIEVIAGKGDYLVALNSQGKLLRSKNEEVTTIWQPRKPKDEIVSFDVGENGKTIIATRAAVFKVDEEIKELTNLKGMPISTIRTDSLCKTSVAVCNFTASFAYEKSTIKAQWGLEYDCYLQVSTETVGVHSAVLHARCPTLAQVPLDKVVAAPGGSSLFYAAEGGFKVEGAPVDSVRAFVKNLYTSTADVDTLSAPSLHEYHALNRLATRKLGPGLLDARDHDVGCDMTLKSGLRAHSTVLKALSPVLAAQLERWGEDLELNSDLALEKTILDYAYTQHLVNERCSMLARVQQLFDLWQASDELLISSLSHTCEYYLFNILDMGMAIPLLRETAPNTKLYASLVDVIVRHLSFFLPLLSDLDAQTVAHIESLFMAAEGSEEVDTALAQSFETLKKTVTTPVAKKKNRTVSNPVSSSTPSVNSPSPSVSPASSALPADKSNTALVSPSKPESTPLGLSSPTPQPNDEGWIKARRKTRGSSTGDRSVVKTALAETMGKPFRIETPVDIGRVDVSRADAAKPRDVAKAGALKPVPPKAGLKLGELPKLGLAAKPNENLRNLPDLPKLGSAPKARTKSASKTSKSKPFNSKSTIHFDPVTIAKELEKPAEPAPWKPATPWKPIAEVRTAPAVLRKLEREHEINCRRTAGGSVWGIKS